MAMDYIFYSEGLGFKFRKLLATQSNTFHYYSVHQLHATSLL